MLSIRHGLASYLIGAFGGVSRLMARFLLTGDWPEELSFEFHRQQPDYARFLDSLGDNYKTLDPPGKFSMLESTLHDIRHHKDLYNGLTWRENLELMSTFNLTRILFLLLKGLRHRRVDI